MKSFLHIIKFHQFKNICLGTMMLFLFPQTVLFAQSGSRDTDETVKIHIFAFQDNGISGSENPDAGERFDYLSDIIPVNLKRDIEAAGNFSISIEKLSPDKNPRTDEEIRSFLKASTDEKSAQIAIFGTFAVVKSAITVNIFFFSGQTGSFKKIQTEGKKIGVMIDSLLSELSASSIAQIQTMTVKRTPQPSISIPENPVELYGSITLMPETPGDEIFFTTDGSEPSKEHGTRYAEPIKTRKNVHISAVSVREGFSPSKPASKDMTVVTPLSRFTVGQTFGSAQLFGSMRHKLKTESMNHFSAYALWELANIESLKRTAFLKNLGISAAFESARFSERNSSGGGNLMLFNGLLQYSVRMEDFLSVDISAGGGYAKVKHTYTDNGSGALDLINVSTQKGESFSKTNFGAGSRINYIWGTLFFHADASYRRVAIPDGALHCIFSGIGIGLRF
jgi:hypothetical protein